MSSISFAASTSQNALSSSASVSFRGTTIAAPRRISAAATASAAVAVPAQASAVSAADGADGAAQGEGTPGEVQEGVQRALAAVKHAPAGTPLSLLQRQLASVLTPFADRLDSRALSSIMKQQEADWRVVLALYDWMAGQGIPRSIHVYTVVLSCLGRAAQWNHLLSVLDDMARLGVPMDDYVYNTLIVAYSNAGRFNDALGWFERMEKAGCMPNQVIYTTVMKLFARAGRTDGVARIAALLREEGSREDGLFRLDSKTICALIAAYNSMGDLKSAQEVFELARAGTPPGEWDVVVWNAMVAAYGRAGKVRQAEELLLQMEAQADGGDGADGRDGGVDAEGDGADSADWGSIEPDWGSVEVDGGSLEADGVGQGVGQAGRGDSVGRVQEQGQGGSGSIIPLPQDVARVQGGTEASEKHMGSVVNGVDRAAGELVEPKILGQVSSSDAAVASAAAAASDTGDDANDLGRDVAVSAAVAAKELVAAPDTSIAETSVAAEPSEAEAGAAETHTPDASAQGTFRVFNSQSNPGHLEPQPRPSPLLQPALAYSEPALVTSEPLPEVRSEASGGGEEISRDEEEEGEEIDMEVERRENLRRAGGGRRGGKSARGYSSSTGSTSRTSWGDEREEARRGRGDGGARRGRETIGAGGGGRGGLEDGSRELSPPRFGPTLNAYNSLLNAYAKAGDVDKAEKTFKVGLGLGRELSPPRFGPTMNAYNALLDVDKAEKTFKRLMARGFYPSTVTFNTLFSLYASLPSSASSLAAARRLHALMLHMDVPLDVYSCCSLIGLLSRSGQVEEAVGLFERMKAQGVQPDSHVFSAMIAMFARHGKLELALRTFQEMKAAGCAVDMPVLTSMIGVYHRLGLLEEASAAAMDAITQGSGHLDPVIASAIISLFSKQGRLGDAAGQLDAAEALFAEILVSGCREMGCGWFGVAFCSSVDAVLLSTMMDAYSKQGRAGQLDAAEALFAEIL
ncbi:unnamed protein product, partial [Closterium sp. Naga37s-1]